MFKKQSDNDQLFAIGDVHGCYYTLMKLIEKLPENAKLIFVGDLCDKGNFTKEVVEFVRKNSYQCVLGDHEQLMLDNIANPHSRWATDSEFGGCKSLESYKDDQEMLNRHHAWFKTLPGYIIKGNCFITHGFGLPYYQRRDAAESKQPLMSNRKTQKCRKEWEHDWENRWFDYHIFNIFGHDFGSTPVSDKNYHNIDSGCVYGERLTAINLQTKALITQETDERDIVSREKGFDFIPSAVSPFGFTIMPPAGFSKENRRQSKHGDSDYIEIGFYKNTENGQIHKNYLFDKDKNHINWQERERQIKNKVESKTFADGYKVVRTREINFAREYEQTNDILYKDGNIIKTSSSLVTDGMMGEIDWIYREHLNDIKEEKEREGKRLEKIKTLLSLDLLAQKEMIVDEVIYFTMMSVFYGPVRDAGPLKALPYAYFQSEYKELARDRFEQLFIHALTVFALVMNESECYKDVDIESYVQSEAKRLNLTDAFTKYFDENVKIDTSKVLG